MGSDGFRDEDHQSLSLKRIVFKILSLVYLAAISFLPGCEEYSLEGLDTAGPPPADTLPAPDTSLRLGWQLPPCGACTGMDRFIDERWSFRTGDVLACGTIDTAIVNYDRTAFTFFGPSACSIDTGLVFTVYLGNRSLTTDLNGYHTPYSAFYYYQHDTIEPHILISRLGEPVTFIIDHYNNQDKSIRGHFAGAVYRSDSSVAFIDGGKFQTYVR